MVVHQYQPTLIILNRTHIELDGKTKDGPVRITVKIFHPNTARSEMQTGRGSTDGHALLFIISGGSQGAANCTHIKLDSLHPFNICHNSKATGLAI